MAGAEAFPRSALEHGDVHMAARIDVHCLFLRAESIEESDPVLARRHGIVPLEYELDWNGDRAGGFRKCILAGAQSGKTEHRALDARLVRHERHADRRAHRYAPV